MIQKIPKRSVGRKYGERWSNIGQCSLLAKRITIFRGASSWYGKRVQNIFNENDQYFRDVADVNAAAHSCVVDSGTSLLPIKGVQDPAEESVRTHTTFSGTLTKSKFKAELFGFVLDFFCLWLPEPSTDWQK